MHVQDSRIGLQLLKVSAKHELRLSPVRVVLEPLRHRRQTHAVRDGALWRAEVLATRACPRSDNGRSDLFRRCWGCNGNRETTPQRGYTANRKP